MRFLLCVCLPPARVEIDPNETIFPAGQPTVNKTPQQKQQPASLHTLDRRTYKRRFSYVRHTALPPTYRMTQDKNEQQQQHGETLALLSNARI
mmetsp:Transcript_38322/g.122891  ORF Transcript_38322/g.122891 Transcript_38322/m.122891 type:complete len:93 (-) Transcript_38322:461-739(-)